MLHGNEGQPKKLRNLARVKAAASHFDVSPSTLWYWAKYRPGFPQPIKAGARVTLFDLDAIEAFLTSKQREGQA